LLSLCTVGETKSSKFYEKLTNGDVVPVQDAQKTSQFRKRLGVYDGDKCLWEDENQVN